MTESAAKAISPSLDVGAKILSNVVRMLQDRFYTEITSSSGEELDTTTSTTVVTENGDEDEEDEDEDEEDDEKMSAIEEEDEPVAEEFVVDLEGVTTSLRDSDKKELAESIVVASARNTKAEYVFVVSTIDPKRAKLEATPVSEAMSASSRRSTWAPGVNYVRAVAKWMRDNDYKHVILLFDYAPTSFIVNAIARECNDLDIELFRRAAFAMHLPSHSLVPKHTALRDSEATEFLSKHFCKRENLAKILDSDPICRWYKFEVGTLVKVEARYGYGLLSTNVKVVEKAV